MPYEKHTWLRGETITAENLNHLEDGIVGEQTTRASQDQLINERIDQVIAPTGEAPNPTEITDARIGEDGTVYNTLGTAIRTQVGDLKNAFPLPPRPPLNIHIQNHPHIYRPKLHQFQHL